MDTQDILSKQNQEHFSILRARKLPELACTVYEMQHKKSGATVIHMHNDDPENLFCISFQTFPSSSNGAAHALEHLVLCGSSRFPVKDPFFAMSRRSLHTFMNAFTGSDFTSYPASSMIKKDLYNLLSVYIDAIFHPLLDKKSFLQEAVRLEFSEKGNPNSSLLRTGVVFNEMKGAYTNPLRRVYRAMNQCLFTKSSYTHDSGGDPKEIPSLTYEDILHFHKTFYHPSKALFFFYGNIDPNEHLAFLEKEILHSCEKAAPLPPFPQEMAHKTARSFNGFYPVEESSEGTDTSYVSFGFKTTDIRNQLEVLALTVLDLMLLENDGSCLKRALLTGGLCKQVFSDLDTENAYIPYVITALGVSAKNTKKFEEYFFSQLEKIAKEGFPQEQVESALHELELSCSEIGSDGSPYGLSLFFRAGLPYQHGVDILSGLAFHELFDKLRTLVKEDPSYFSKLIHTYLLNNSHRATVVLHPSKTVAKEESFQAQKLLEKEAEKLSAKEKETIIKNSRELEKMHEQEQNLDCLPTIQLSDVPKKDIYIHLEESFSGNYPVFSSPCFTNGLCYIDLVSSLPHYDPEMIWMVQLFLYLMPQLGCGNKSYVESLAYLQAYTGGICSFFSLNPQADNAREIAPKWQIQGKCLERNVDRLCTAISSMLTELRLDEKDRIKQLVLKLATSLEQSIPSKALNYALLQSQQHISPALFLLNEAHGLPFLKHLLNLASTYDSQEKQFLEKLESIKNSLHLDASTAFVLSAQESSIEKLFLEEWYGLANIKPQPHNPWKMSSEKILSCNKNTGYIIASNVNYTALSFRTCPFTDTDSAPLSVVSHLMNNAFLHTAIREKGGAYGGGAKTSSLKGCFSFYSYKDPHLFSTVQSYEICSKYIEDGLFSDQQLIEAKLNVFQDLDLPIAPGNKAITAYMRRIKGLSEERRNYWRDAVFSTTRKQVMALVPKYFSHMWRNSPFIAFGSKETLEKEQRVCASFGETFALSRIKEL